MKSLQYTTETLDQYLKIKFNLDSSIVQLNKIVDTDGSSPLNNQNKVVLTLINVEQETAQPFYVRNQKMANGNYSDFKPTQRFNLDLLVTSNFDDYNETLRFLNSTILFFQVNPVLDSSVNSNIPAGLNKLEFDVEKLTYHQMHSLWTAMGAKYQPSIIYKVRLLSIQANENTGYTSGVSGTSNTVAA